MSSVKITTATYTRSGSTISGKVTIEPTYNETETRLDIGFVPTVIVTPSVDSTKTVQVGMSGWAQPIYLVEFRKEVVRALGVIRPSGAKTATLTFTITLSELFMDGRESSFPTGAGGLDWRVELRPEISTSTAATSNQMIAAG